MHQSPFQQSYQTLFAICCTPPPSPLWPWDMRTCVTRETCAKNQGNLLVGPAHTAYWPNVYCLHPWRIKKTVSQTPRATYSCVSAFARACVRVYRGSVCAMNARSTDKVALHPVMFTKTAEYQHPYIVYIIVLDRLFTRGPTRPCIVPSYNLHYSITCWVGGFFSSHTDSCHSTIV